MKAPSPAFSFYPKDIMTDEACAAMTDEELGVYVRLLCHAWLEGSIPADVGRLARMARRSRPVFEKLWRAVAPCWRTSPDDPARLVQGRLEQERAKQVAYSQRQGAIARAGAAKRVRPAGSTKEASRGSATGQPRSSHKAARARASSPSPSSSSTPDNGNGSPGAVAPGAPVAQRGGWPARFCEEVWKPFGAMAPGRLGAALAGVVREHGEDPTAAGLLRWLQAGNARFGPENFALDAVTWITGQARAAPGAGGSRAQRIDAKVAAGIARAQQAEQQPLLPPKDGEER